MTGLSFSFKYFFLSLAGFLCVASAILGFVQRLLLVGGGEGKIYIYHSALMCFITSAYHQRICIYVCRSQEENIIGITLVFYVFRYVWRLLWWKALNIAEAVISLQRIYLSSTQCNSKILLLRFKLNPLKLADC